MNYEPKEGVDYLVDLYQVAQVEPDAEIEEIRSAIRARLMEYHPDRLHGLAPEFRAKGERLGKLLTRANVILLDPEKRSQYDAMMDEWDGLISSDGTPVVRISDEIKHRAGQQTAEELESSIESMEQTAAGLFKHDPSRRQMFETLYDTADGDMKNKLREELDRALLAEDQVLASTQDFRARLVGIPEDSLIQIGEDHIRQVRMAIEAARTSKLEENRRRALGGFDTRLALMAGEITVDQASEQLMKPASADLYILPKYFEDQAEQLVVISNKRQEIAERRLELFEPTYPEAAYQIEAHPHFVIGLANSNDHDSPLWIGFHFDANSVSLTNVGIPEDIRNLLDQKSFKAVYDSGYNVLTFITKEQLDNHLLLSAAYNKHLERYFPGILDEDASDNK